MKLTFWGAVGTVTGSMHEIAAGGERTLLDCGLYQGRRAEARERNSNFPFPPDAVARVILSHAHIDHSGNLPGLVKQGFHGPILATAATQDLCAAMLKDSAYLQQKDAEYLNKRLARRRSLELDDIDGEEIQPLYTIEDAERTLPLFSPVPYRRLTRLNDSMSFEFYDAGHILGSASLVLQVQDGKSAVRVAFSGDIGRPGAPILRDPEQLPEVDYLILESTYGGRLHQPGELVSRRLADVINRTCRRGGRIIVPAFAVGRTQQLVLALKELAASDQIPKIPIFVDSPLAIDVTEVYRNHVECLDKITRDYVLEGDDPFGFATLRYIRDVSQSKALNDLRGPCVIISASGMAEGGRILHHLKNNITDPRNTVLITGFQAQHTLGRKLVERLPEVPIFGEPVRLRAEVVKLNELSAHADQKELLAWIRPIAAKLKTIFLVHGEPAQSEALKIAIEERYSTPVVLPERGQSFRLT